MNNKSVALDDTLANNAFYDKYKAKIAALQQYTFLTMHMHFTCSLFQHVIYFIFTGVTPRF